ncbi:MAG: glycerate kinase [Candidatus Bathyarchaeota archaeon]|nr:glycerate kinase [Candidatus Bathyarchaeota archaeon]
MVHIQNRQQLIENGATGQLRKARAFALHSLECALNAADPKQLLHSKVKLENSLLTVEGGDCFNLENFRHVYVVGGGKAGSAMAQALEEVLGKYITAGLVNVPYGTKLETAIIELNEASHPVPDQAGVEGTFRILDFADQAKDEDLVICLISGGGSSLMPLPRTGVSLKDKQTLTDALLKSGAPITEINIVRKHLSAFKGGWLAKKAYPATLLNLILSDVIGDPLESIASGPTVPDPSTFRDAQNVLEKHGLWQTAPVSVRKVLSEGSEGLLEETPKPKDPAFNNVYNVIIGNNRTASQAAAECLKSEGLKTIHFDDPLDGEASHIGKALAKFACRVSAHDFSLPKPIAVVAGGETTVVVTGKGLGGRNQELELSAAMHLKDAQTCVIASLSTDGVDGPTDAAGAIVDGYTLKRTTQLGLTPETFLADNDSYHFFSKLGDLIITKPTGTNVNDISVIIVL